MKQLIAFDLDGTLAPSKQAIDPEMARLLRRLTQNFMVAVISGGDWPQFEAQLIGNLPDGCDFSHWFLLPTSGTKLYRYAGGWRLMYAETLTAAERALIIGALEKAIAALSLGSAPSWGARIEDRGTQITFSALGQQAPLDAKLAWDPDMAKRNRIQAMIAPILADFEVRIGGSTSIDVTRKGIDKGYAIGRLAEASGTAVSDMMFIGDALFPGGNDHAVIGAGVAAVAVRDVEETKRIIEAIILCRQ